MLYVIILILSITCFFIVFELCKSDFLLLRKDISLETVFNHIFISLAVSLVFARLMYILDTDKLSFISPLVFFHIVKYSGISLYGTFVGMCLPLIYLFRKNLVSQRVLDIVSLAFCPALTMYLFLNPVIYLPFFVRVALFLFFAIPFILFLHFHKNYSLKDGSVFFVLLIIFSVINILVNFYSPHKNLISIFSFSQILSMILVIVSLVLFVKNESFSSN